MGGRKQFVRLMFIRGGCSLLEDQKQFVRLLFIRGGCSLLDACSVLGDKAAAHKGRVQSIGWLKAVHKAAVHKGRVQSVGCLQSVGC